MMKQNRNQLQLKEGITLAEAHAAESDFFRSHPVFGKVGARPRLDTFTDLQDAII